MLCSCDCYIFCDNCGTIDDLTAICHYDIHHICGPPKEMCNRCWTVIGVKSFPIFVDFRRRLNEHGSMLTYDKFLTLWQQQRTINDDPLYPISMSLPTVEELQSTFPKMCSMLKILNSVCACNEFIPTLQDITKGFIYHTKMMGLPVMKDTIYPVVSIAKTMISLPKNVYLPIQPPSFLKIRVINIDDNATYDVEADVDEIVNMIIGNEIPLQSMDEDYELPDLI